MAGLPNGPGKGRRSYQVETTMTPFKNALTKDTPSTGKPVAPVGKPKARFKTTPPAAKGAQRKS